MSLRSFRLALICYAALWAALPNIAHAMPDAAAAGDAAAAAVQPGHGWSRPKHIQAESKLKGVALRIWPLN